MNTKKLISSGLLERYCQGMLDMEEQAIIELSAVNSADIQNAITGIKNKMADHALTQPVIPPMHVKNNLFLKIYELESGEGKLFPPLINDSTNTEEFSEWLSTIELIHPDTEKFKTLYSQALPGTEQVSNFLVWAKGKIEEETHDHCTESIVILKGSCNMYFEGVKKYFTEGEIIRVPKNVKHYAEVTSAEPMLAVVQRVFA